MGKRKTTGQRAGVALAEYRKIGGFSATDTARKAGISRQTLCELEGGRLENPTLETLEGVAKAIGLRLGTLFIGLEG